MLPSLGRRYSQVSTRGLSGLVRPADTRQVSQATLGLFAGILLALLTVNAVIYIRVPDALKQALEEHAARRGLSQTRGRSRSSSRASRRPPASTRSRSSRAGSPTRRASEQGRGRGCARQSSRLRRRASASSRAPAGSVYTSGSRLEDLKLPPSRPGPRPRSWRNRSSQTSP